MKKFTTKQNAKLNITLDVFEKNGEFHPINSFCVPISLCDKITVKKRKDNKIILKEKGIKTGVDMQKNNAYRAAELFLKEKGGTGVDIIVKKNIPLSSGLGGSSADVSGVITCMEKLFNKSGVDLLSRLGSDTTFTYYKKQAVLKGKGDFVEFTDFNFNGYALIITDKTPILSKRAYNIFDEMEKRPLPCTDKVIELLRENKNCYSLFKNDLQEPAISILPILSEKIENLDSVGSLKSQVTGSGSAVYGIFKDEKSLNKAKRQLRKKYKNHLIKVKF